MNQIFIAAHFQEAQSFIDFFHMRKMEDNFFSNNEQSVMICGEGKINGLFATTKLLENLKLAKNLPQKIINIGVAGIIRNDNEFKKGDVVKIRTTYSHQLQSPHFLSFTSANYTKAIDCLTVEDRILDKNKRILLSPFAHLADRELWSIAYVAKKYQIPFESYKIISDDFNSEDFCGEVILQSANFSNGLLQYFLNDSTENKETNIADKKQFNLPIEFHVTFTQRHQIQKYLDILNRQQDLSLEDILEFAEVKIIRTEKILPKIRTQKFIEFLMEMTGPKLVEVKKQISQLISQIKNEQIEINLNELLEEQGLHLKIHLKDKNQWAIAKSKIDNFDFEKLFRIQNGQI